MTPEDVAKQLKQQLEEERNARLRAEEDAKALKEEFAQADDIDKVRELVLEKIQEAGARAVIKLVYLIDHAESEAIQASTSKYVTDLILSGKLKDPQVDNSVNELIKQLAKND